MRSGLSTLPRLLDLSWLVFIGKSVMLVAHHHALMQVPMKLACLAALSCALIVCGTTPGTCVTARLGTYYEDTVSRTCASTTNCRLNFSAVPTDKQLLVTFAGCTTRATVPITQLYLGISPTLGAEGNGRYVPLAFGVTNPVNGIFATSANQTINFLVAPGRFPFVVYAVGATATSLYISCFISGTLQN